MATMSGFLIRAIQLPFKASSLNVQERLFTLATFALFLTVPLWMWWYQDKHIPGAYPKDARIFDLTGLGSTGSWTLEEVEGYNYWWKSFPPAVIKVDEGALVVLRLKSADATHVFYAPTLGVGPVTIEPGHVEVVTFRAGKKGVYEYYCMAVCGECHFFMRGTITVGDMDNPAIAVTAAQLPPVCQHLNREPASPTFYEKGEQLFKMKGCIACHGEGGKGGVANPNYLRGTVPSVSTLATTLSLEDKQSADEFARLVEEGGDLDQLADKSADIPRHGLVLAKYQIVRDVIEKGRPAARADTTSFEPPLSMPMWHQKLSPRDIDALIVYLLKQQKWEGERE